MCHNNASCCEGNLGNRRWQTYQVRGLRGQCTLEVHPGWIQTHLYKLCGDLWLEEETWGFCTTNFVGAQKELENAFKEMDHQKIQYFFQSIGADYIPWCRNPPASSHIGGVLEK